MKFLVDAQLPRRLSHALAARGHDTIHTWDLPDGNATSDGVINDLSVQEHRVVITKDADFVESLIVLGVPYKLLLISTGNINNQALEQLFLQNLDDLIAGLHSYVLVELDRTAIRFHF